jgi:hypothetical protein
MSSISSKLYSMLWEQAVGQKLQPDLVNLVWLFGYLVLSKQLAADVVVQWQLVGPCITLVTYIQAPYRWHLLHVI